MAEEGALSKLVTDFLQGRPASESFNQVISQEIPSGWK